MTHLSPEALAWLVERLNKSAARLHGQPVSARVVDGDQQLCGLIGEPNSIHLLHLLSLPETMCEAAAAILALEAQGAEAVAELNATRIDYTAERDAGTHWKNRATRAEAQVADLTLQRDTARMAADTLKANPPTTVVSGRYRADRATRAEAVLREITEERDELRCALEVHRTMRSEVGHAMAGGPDWYTKGESGLRGQVRMWLTFADEAYTTLARSLAAPVEKEKE